MSSARTAGPRSSPRRSAEPVYAAYGSQSDSARSPQDRSPVAVVASKLAPLRIENEELKIENEERTLFSQYRFLNSQFSILNLFPLVHIIDHRLRQFGSQQIVPELCHLDQMCALVADDPVALVQQINLAVQLVVAG